MDDEEVNTKWWAIGNVSGQYRILTVKKVFQYMLLGKNIQMRYAKNLYKKMQEPDWE